MTRSRSQGASAPPKPTKKRKPRARPTPKWLARSDEGDDMARRRCLMILSVLSGERSVTEVVEETKMSRATYYQLEERGLMAMMQALAPLAGPDGAETTSLQLAVAKVAELEDKLARLEKERRRSDRLLYLTRKLVKPGAMTTGAGWPAGRPRGRKKTGASSPSSPTSSTSPTAKTTPAKPPTTSTEAMTPTKAGAAGRWSGSGS